MNNPFKRYKHPIDISDELSDLSRVSVLLCPLCKESALHHGTVGVFSRDFEDSEVGLRTTAGRNVITDKSMIGIPSSRRDGIRIEMECENCGELPFDLGLAQHKGATFLMWFDKCD